MSAQRLWAAAFAALLCGASGCGESEKAAQPSPAAAEPAAASAPAAAEAAPIPPAERRALAERALSAQRIYTPAGDSAIEHFLQLRDDGGADASLETALLELLPYAVIGCEQAMARQDLAEAQRLLALIERADATFPAVVRLRAALAEADGALAQQALAAAETEKQRLLKVARDAELAAAAATAVAQTAPDPAPAAQAPQPVAAPAALAAPTVATTAPVVAAATAPATAPDPDPAPATASTSPSPSPVANATRALLSAPPPRYPLSARRRKLEGDVTLTFTIQPDGSVVLPRVVAATTPGLFDEAALAAASRWRFEPAAAPVQVTRQLRFRLD